MAGTKWTLQPPDTAGLASALAATDPGRHSVLDQLASRARLNVRG